MEHERVPLGRTDLMVPRLGIGAMVWGRAHGSERWTPAQLAYGPTESAADEEAALDVSIAAGVNLVDTAEFYAHGLSERRVGELAQGRDVIIATKFPPRVFSRVDDFPAALAASLAQLRCDRIDVFQHHFPSKRVPIPKLMTYMADAVDAGKVCAVGVSNYSAEETRLAHAELAKRGIPLASNQIEYSLLRRQPETNGVLDTCRELGVTLMAYSPLAGGALTGKYSAHGPRAKGLRPYLLGQFRRKSLEELEPVIALLREIGTRHGKTPNQVALRWLLEQDGVLPIAGAKNAEQAASNAGALGFTLSADEVDAVSRATSRWRS